MVSVAAGEAVPLRVAGVAVVGTVLACLAARRLKEPGGAGF